MPSCAFFLSSSDRLASLLIISSRISLLGFGVFLIGESDSVFLTDGRSSYSRLHLDSPCTTFSYASGFSFFIFLARVTVALLTPSVLPSSALVSVGFDSLGSLEPELSLFRLFGLSL